MKLTYQLTKADLVAFNEYHSAHSPLHIKMRRRHRILVPIFYLVLAAFWAFHGDYTVPSMLAVAAVLWFLLSPRWLRRRYRKHFQKHVEETIGDALETPTTVELREDGIHSTGHMGHSVFNYSVVDKIVENDGFTYIYIGKGMALIVPHDRVPAGATEELTDGIKARL